MTKTGVGISVIRKEAWEKVTGQAKYTDDFISNGKLSAKIVTSTYAHAMIESIDISKAAALPGVKAVLTGTSYPILCGPLIEDRPPLAKESDIEPMLIKPIIVDCTGPYNVNNVSHAANGRGPRPEYLPPEPSECRF